MTPSEQSPAYVRYRSFVLRLWRDSAAPSWRMSLQDVASGEQHGFAGLVSLMAFLEEQVADAPSAPSVADDH